MIESLFRNSGRLGRILEGVRRKIQPLLDRKLEAMTPEVRQDEQDFVADADYSMVMQEPLRARLLVRSLMIVLILFVLWSAVTQVDEITRGEGRVVPSRQLQVLQSLDGGVVAEISVREGDVVNAGQVLLKIDPTRFVSSAGESHSQQLALKLKTERLRALADNKPFVPPPEALREDPRMVEEERNLYETERSNLDAQLSIARQQMAQRQHELSEAQARRAQASQAYELTSKELGVTRGLLKSGAVSEVEIYRLERDVSRFLGEREMASAQIQRSQAAIAEASRKIQEVELNFRNQQRTELSEAQARLNALLAGSAGLEDKVKHAVIRAPMRGTVKRLLVNTVGGVVQPGKDAVEIVPLEDNLLLEARVAPRDIAFLRPGQPAQVRFTAYDFAIYGGLEATLEQIGADSLMDERGNAYYLVRVRTLKSQLGENLPVIPGMVAQVDIITGRKSVLSYLLKPITRAKSAVFTER